MIVMDEVKNNVVVDNKNKKYEAIYISMLVVTLIGVMLAGVYSGYIDK